MIEPNDILFSSAHQIVKKIKIGDWGIVEVLTTYLQQIEKYNSKINAVTDMYSKAALLKEAKQKEAQLKSGVILGPLYGLPMTIKDSYAVKGLIQSNGNPSLKKNRATYDATFVRHLREAGAIIIGKTNLPLFALDWQSTNKWFGQTNNPYNLKRVVGGSSGGSAASIASGFAALEMGSDIAGSIRVPAHFCGVCGLRPSEGALSLRGQLTNPGGIRSLRYITCGGPLARNIADLQLALSVLWQKQEQESELAPVDLHYSQWAKNQGLKIAYSSQLNNVQLDKEYEAIFHQFIGKLKQQSYFVQEAKPEYDYDQAVKIWGALVGFDFRTSLPKQIPFKSIAAYLFLYNMHRSPKAARVLADGIGANLRDYAQSLEQKDEISDQFNRFFEDWDIWITPVTPTAAFKHQRSGKPFLVNGKKVPYAQSFMPYNLATAVMGHPIVSLPIGQTKDGLPLGIQIHGRRWHDYKLLQIAEELEKLTLGFQIPKMFLV